jgi:uridine monophosphate synthetase
MTAGTPADAARRLRDQLNEARAELSRHRPRAAAAPTPSAAMAGSTANDSGSTVDIRARLTGELAALADALLESGCVRLGAFELKSGGRSPIYFDLRRVVGSPELLSRVASLYLPLLAGLRFDRLAAVPYAGLPIATAVSLQSKHPLVYPRKETKGYGTGAAVEGGFKPGESVVVLDDVATTAASKFEAIDRLTAAGLLVRDVVVLIDREGGARHALAQAGYTLHAVFSLSQLLDHWEVVGAVGVDDIVNVREYMAREQG